MKVSSIGSIAGVLILIVLLKYISYRRLGSRRTGGWIYHYTNKSSLMTNVENEFFDMLTDAIGIHYFVFPQVHLSSILEHKVKGQNWKAAFRSINGKSVDYILSDKITRKPLVAIELDDYTHGFEDRKQRDIEVERMLEEATIPLLRFTNYKAMTIEEIRQRISESLIRV